MLGVSKRTTDLSEAEKKKLIVALMEKKRRGQDIKGILDDQDKMMSDWSLDKNGYFIKIDGKRYVPDETKSNFINDRSVFISLLGGRGAGKCLDIYTPICTINGWKLLRDIRVGDHVFDDLGKETEVVSVSDILYGHRCFKITFSDESTLIADEDHLWKVLDRDNRHRHSKGREFEYNFVRTEYMYKNLYKLGEVNYSVDCAKPLELPEKELPIPPYVLGVWLGDGSKNRVDITLGETKLGILNTIRSFGIEIIEHKEEYSYGLSFGTTGVIRNVNTGRFETNDKSFYYALKSLNLIGNKHIPIEYLRSSIEQRKLLLAGLMDTDGYIDKKGRCEFCVTNETLADGFYDLMMSLGYKIVKKVGTVMLNGEEFIRYRFSFVPDEKVFLSRNSDYVHGKHSQKERKYRRFITYIQETPSVPVKCITVDSKSHLFLAGTSLIPTHNSGAGAQKALKKIMAGESGSVVNPSFENFKYSTWPELRSWIPWNMVVPSQRFRKREEWEPHKPFTMVFLNGAKMFCKGLHSPDGARGPNNNWLWFDEGAMDMEGMAWKIAIASVRVGDTPQSWVTTTPRGTEHWLYEFFVEQSFSEDAKKLFEDIAGDRKLLAIYSASIDDNKNNLDPLFYASMMAAYPAGSLRSQELDGQFVAVEGVLGDPMWFRNKVLNESPIIVKSRIRYWDLAATEKKITGKKANDPDETVGTLLSWDGENFYIEDQVSGCWDWEDIKKQISFCASLDGTTVPIYIEQEPGAGGKNQVAQIGLESELANYSVRGHRPEGDKVQRANIWFAEAKMGKFYIVNGAWNRSFLSQLGSFPTPKIHDDKVDSVSGARVCIAPIKKWSRIKFMSV